MKDVDIILATAAVLTFVFAVYKWRSNEKNEQRRQWQMRVIYKVFCDADKNLLDFKFLRQEYLNAATQLGGVRRSTLQDDALYDVIIRLIEREIIYHDKCGCYGLKRMDSRMLALEDGLRYELLKTQFCSNYVEVEIQGLLKGKSEGMEQEVIYSLLKNQFPGISKQDFIGTIGSLQTRRMIEEKESKLVLTKPDS